MGLVLGVPGDARALTCSLGDCGVEGISPGALGASSDSCVSPLPRRGRERVETPPSEEEEF